MDCPVLYGIYFRFRGALHFKCCTKCCTVLFGAFFGTLLPPSKPPPLVCNPPPQPSRIGYVNAHLKRRIKPYTPAPTPGVVSPRNFGVIGPHLGGI